MIDLPAGATPLDFAYALHTDLGHRCRGARVDGAMVPLNTPLRSGQTVEVISAREGGPSLDWLNAELGYLHSPRARAKVRSWFNSLQQAQTIARGRERSRSCCSARAGPRSSSTTWPHQLGFRNADALFEVVGKDEYLAAQHRGAAAPGRAALRRPIEVIAQQATLARAPPSGRAAACSSSASTR